MKCCRIYIYQAVGDISPCSLTARSWVWFPEKSKCVSWTQCKLLWVKVFGISQE